MAGPMLEPGERREDLVESSDVRGGNTTLGVVATNASLSKPNARRLARSANDAVDGAIRPAHTIYDGDTVFALATQQVAATFEQVAALVEPAVTTAIRRAVTRDDGKGVAGTAFRSQVQRATRPRTPLELDTPERRSSVHGGHDREGARPVSLPAL